MTRQVTFNPCGITVRVEEGENLLRAALDAGVHGGRVWVELRGKKGITFCVSFSKNL